MKLPPEQSPCRPHPCSVEHADLVYTIRMMREDWEREAERATLGYTTEFEEYVRDHPRPNLRDVLQHNRRRT